mgnify:CR=1 FL=1
MKILLAITFVYGVLYFVSMTKLFDTKLSTLFRSLTGLTNESRKNSSVIGGILAILDIWFVYFSMAFQAWYWLF